MCNSLRKESAGSQNEFVTARKRNILFKHTPSCPCRRLSHDFCSEVNLRVNSWDKQYIKQHNRQNQNQNQNGFIRPECLYIQGIYFGRKVQTYNIQHCLSKGITCNWCLQRGHKTRGALINSHPAYLRPCNLSLTFPQNRFLLLIVCF